MHPSTLKKEIAFSGILTQVHHCSSGLTLYQCYHLVRYLTKWPYQVATLAAYLGTTLVKHKSWKVMMDLGQDPREGSFFPDG